MKIEEIEAKIKDILYRLIWRLPNPLQSLSSTEANAVINSLRKDEN